VVAGIGGGLLGGQWLQFGPTWRDVHWLAAVVGGIVVSLVVGVVLRLIRQPRPIEP
jgi:hypothetical protein